MNRALELTVNGTSRKIEIDPARSLLSVLRDVLELTGTKYGCGEAQCGACTVMIDGRAVRSCVTTAGFAEGKSITTIEGFGHEGALHPLQQAFVEIGALQCGYCTSGMIVSAAALLATKSEPSERDIVQHMDGNVCRCGTYPRIVKAIQLAATRMKEKQK